MRVRYANGDKYSGSWKDGKQHGFGTYTYSGGKFEARYYEDGVKKINPINQIERRKLL